MWLEVCAKLWNGRRKYYCTVGLANSRNVTCWKGFCRVIMESGRGREAVCSISGSESYLNWDNKGQVHLQSTTNDDSNQVHEQVMLL